MNPCLNTLKLTWGYNDLMLYLICMFWSAHFSLHNKAGGNTFGAALVYSLTLQISLLPIIKRQIFNRGSSFSSCG